MVAPKRDLKLVKPGGLAETTGKRSRRDKLRRAFQVDGAVSDRALSDGAVSDRAVSDGAVSDGAVSSRVS